MTLKETLEQSAQKYGDKTAMRRVQRHARRCRRQRHDRAEMTLLDGHADIAG